MKSSVLLDVWSKKQHWPFAFVEFHINTGIVLRFLASSWLYDDIHIHKKFLNRL